MLEIFWLLVVWEDVVQEEKRKIKKEKLSVRHKRTIWFEKDFTCLLVGRKGRKNACDSLSVPGEGCTTNITSVPKSAVLRVLCVLAQRSLRLMAVKKMPA